MLNSTENSSESDEEDEDYFEMEIVNTEERQLLKSKQPKASEVNVYNSEKDRKIYQQLIQSCKHLS